MKRRGIGSHASPNNGQNELWLKPPALLSRLGKFDLDPCACPEPRPWPTATRHIALPEDGLKAEWGERERIYLNPPYGDKLAPWLERMAVHKNGILITLSERVPESSMVGKNGSA